MTVRVLVVDDLSDMRTLLGFSLRRNNWEVLEARNGEQAIEIARSENPDIIIMDYDMPKMNGLEACRALSADPSTSSIPIIIYTGYGASHVKEDVMNAGARSFLLKPITPNRLRDEIQSFLPAE